MIKAYKGYFPYTKAVLDGWNSTEKGVYYIGIPAANGSLAVYYVGQGCGLRGMKGRLLEHLGEWRNMTHFGYCGGDTDAEVAAFEVAEIKRLQPQHNTQGL